MMTEGSRRITRGMSAAGLTVAIAAGLLGCTFGEPGAERAVEGFDSVYEQDVQWGGCESLDGVLSQIYEQVERDPADRRCAMVSVPMDWVNPDGDERIDIAVERIPATGKNPQGSILVNPGGPGMPGIPFTQDLAARGQAVELGRQYDIIGFDPRGIGESTPLDCSDVSSEVTAIQIAKCAEGNEIAHHMGTAAAARDMDVIRYILGDSKLNYLGYSYGTVLGATYADMFPNLVGRMVLDSADNAQWASLPNVFDQRVAIIRAIGRLGAQCEADTSPAASCPFVSEASFDSFLEKVGSEPLRASNGMLLDAESMHAFFVNVLYSGTSDRSLMMALAASAARGSQDAIDEIAVDPESAAPDMAGQIVRCHSVPAHPDIAEYVKHVEQSDAPAMLGTSTDELIGEPDLSCYALPEAGDDSVPVFRAEGSDPILVVGIRGDHATPYEHAESLVEGLDNVVLLTLEGDGHAASFNESTCIDDAVIAYFLEGTLPAAGTSCGTQPQTSGNQSLTVDIIEIDSDGAFLQGTAAPGATVNIVGLDAGDPPVSAEVKADGTWGPVHAPFGCLEVRAVPSDGTVAESMSICADPPFMEG